MSLSFNIDTAHPTPLYHQLERAIRFSIATGKLAVGDQLPTVRQLAVDLRINAKTVAKVYADRERELREIEDHFLSQAAHLGFTATDAVAHLSERLKKMK